MHRFFVDLVPGAAPVVGQRVVLDATEARHLRTVLRATSGAVLGLTDGRGHELDGVLEDAGRRGCAVRITAVRRADEEVAPPRLHLACAVVKGRRFEYALEKAVELGVHALTPLLCARGVVDPREGKLDRWRGLLIAALKQSGRCHLPQLRPPAEPAATLAAAAGPVWFGAAPAEGEGTAPRDLRAALAAAAAERTAGAPVPGELLLLIGPEGGWTSTEIALIAGRGAAALSLGPHVLRTETAAAAGLVALQALRAAWRT